MLPLALIMRGLGYDVSGSDRALDQGRLSAKFDDLRKRGIGLHPQDGSGITRKSQVLVTSAAVEDTIPDVQAARALGLLEARRANLLAELFNSTPVSIGIGGTSGKSTTTGMTGWILHHTGRAPTIMNGAVMKNFANESNPFASATTGAGQLFVSEVDESDGSIVLYRPTVGVVTNISLDHKPLSELKILFGDFVASAGTAVLNADDADVRALATRTKRTLTFGLEAQDADFLVSDIKLAPLSSTFHLRDKRTGKSHACHLQQPGRHNIANAAAAITAAVAAGAPVDEACSALSSFTGIRRRFDIVGSANGMTVIDDFAHNPDKIAATLATLHNFPGRLIVLFQPHGYGPLRLMGADLIDAFAKHLYPADILIMPEPAYYGGTTTRDVSSMDIIRGVSALNRDAIYEEHRADCIAVIRRQAKPGDRVIVMGARDDTLSEFAAQVLAALS
jgi:UDP-N-acetylmuramate--alanine ligase